MENIITAENLVFEYVVGDTGEKNRVLKGIDLTVKKGEFLAVLGHNGSGKSTLAKHFNGILMPTEGRVTVDGIDTRDEGRLFDLRRRVGMVFQNPDNQMVATIVEEDVAFAPENLGVPRDEIRRRVDRALETVGMSDFKRHAPHMLSGGQKQRVAIAGVLAMEPEILVMDEPTAMLDPIGRFEVLETVKRLNREQGMTVALITHYMDEAVQADRVVVVDSGRIAMEGTPRQVFPRVEELVKLGLDVPQSTYLAYMLNREGINIDSSVLDDKECADAILDWLKRDGGNADDRA